MANGNCWAHRPIPEIDYPSFEHLSLLNMFDWFTLNSSETEVLIDFAQGVKIKNFKQFAAAVYSKECKAVIKELPKMGDLKRARSLVRNYCSRTGLDWKVCHHCDRSFC